MKKQKSPKISEAEYAKIVVSYFEELGYDVYKEVSFGGSSIRADIYCKKGNETIAIETKTSLNLSVIDQAYNWRNYSSKSYIAIPYQKYRQFSIAHEICENFGIGILLIYKESRHKIRDLIVEKLASTVNIESKEPALFEEQKDSVAGNNLGQFITPFKITCKLLVELIKEKGPMPLKTAVNLINHHYANESSATQNLRKMILWGVLKEIELFKEGNKYGIRLKSKA